jgi:hypothetical protein|mmetsp:Transcript_50413/g.84306  ORF Transcript_50413/g.84306 Transcript_50413/m.84306 type:complete len:94 (-) Transcript_50413:34-315(-)
MRAVYSIGHGLPCARHDLVSCLLHWLTAKAVWDGDRYTDMVIPDPFKPDGYTPAWCTDAALLRAQATPRSPPLLDSFISVCVSVTGWLHPAQH